MNDPYTTTNQQVMRLLREYKSHKKLIVAVDFDDTVYDFHEEGHTYVTVIELLLRCQRHGFYICLFTGTHEDTWYKQKMYMANQGIGIHSVNRNPFPLPFGNHGKMYYNILLDDRAGLGQAIDVLVTVLDVIEEFPEEHDANFPAPCD